VIIKVDKFKEKDKLSEEMARGMVESVLKCKIS